MNNNIDLKKTEKMNYISFWCQKVIPLVFDDSLSYYENVCKFMQKLNEVISALNNNAECIDELQDKYIILQKNFDALENKWEEFKTYIENEFNNFKNEINTKQTEFETKINNEFTSFKTYVENYLDNIDVASFVNTKIDEMVASGEFNTLIENALSSLVAGDGIKIENGAISTTNYKATNNYSGITTNMIQVGTTNNTKQNTNNNSIGGNNTFTDGANNIILGYNNIISKNNTSILGNNNTITSQNTICVGNFLKPEIGQIVIGKYNLSTKPLNAIIIGNGNDDSNRHNAIVIPQGTSTPISINQEINCSDNFITRTYVEGDRIENIYNEKPNALVNASEVFFSLETLREEFNVLSNNIDYLNNNINYKTYILNFENNITGNGYIHYTNLSSSPMILYTRFMHPGKTAGGEDTEFKIGTIDFSDININKDFIPRYINAFVNKYPCIISLRTTDNANIYDMYYDGNAIPENIGATNFYVKFNQIIGFRE